MADDNKPGSNLANSGIIVAALAAMGVYYFHHEAPLLDSRPAVTEVNLGQQANAHQQTIDARLWQDANVVQAPTLQFDRDHRSLVAHGDAQGNLAQPVSTVLVQVEKSGKVTPVHITSARLNYTDAERKIFLDGGVTAKGSDATLTGQQMTVFLRPRSELQAGTGMATGPNPATPGQVERIIAEKSVVITEPARHATGDRLVYTSADEKFVLTGGPPSIFDAERGKITGDSLTFFRHDDRVLVEGKETSPTVTKTQVAR